MVRTKGTILSLDAAGSLHKTLIASSWKGRQYLKSHSIPNNPRSGEQISIRSMFAFLSSEWDSTDYEDKQTWVDDAELLKITPFNFYLQTNLERWSSFLKPSRFLEILEVGNYGVFSINFTPLGNRILRGNFNLTTVNNNWGLIIHQSMTSGFTPNLTNVVDVIPMKTLGMFRWFRYKCELGTNYVRICRFNTNGKHHTYSYEYSPVVT